MLPKIQVSVIIPVYNVESYIDKCLETVCGQRSVELEIICIDDASTDGSHIILEKWSKKDKRISVIRNTKNCGLSFARNIGLQNSSGKYIYFVDGDDYLKDEHALSTIHQILEDNELEVLIFDAEVIYDSLDISHVQYDGKRKGVYPGIYEGPYLFRLLLEKADFDATVWRQIWRRDFLEKNDIAFYNGIIHEDILFTFKSFMSAKRMMCSNLSIYVYRKRYGSITVDGRLDLEHFCSYLTIYRELLVYLDGKKYPSDVEFSVCKFIEWKEHDIVNWYLKCYANCVINHDDLFADSLARVLWWQAWQKKFRWLKCGFCKEEYDQLISCKKIIVYGAGEVGKDVLNLLVHYGFKDRVCLAVTKKNFDIKIGGFIVHEIKELVDWKYESVVIVAVSEKYCNEIVWEVKKYGFKKYICLK